MEPKNLDLRAAAVSWGNVIEMGARVLLGLMYGAFLYIFVKDFIEHGRFSSFLFAIVESVFVYMSITRRAPAELSKSGRAWLFAYVGTFAPLLLNPSASGDFVVGYVIQLAGILLIGFSIGSLGRSFGLVAANRGIVTAGIYRYVRHPLYMAYFVNVSGFVINNCSWHNTVVIIFWAAAQFARIKHEEQLLRNDGVYARFMDRVRWRLIPHIY